MNCNEVDGTALSYPVLCLAQDGSITLAVDSERLHRCNARAFFTTHYFNELLIIDSTSAIFRVVAADPADQASSIKTAWTRALNSEIRVQLRVRPEAAPSLDGAKALVVAWLDRAPELWDAVRDVGEWKKSVLAAPDVQSLFALFA